MIRKSIPALIGFMLVIFYSVSYANAENIFKENFNKFIDNSHYKITNKVSERAQWFDNFFGTEKVNSKNKTTLRFSLGPEWSEVDHLKMQFKLRAKFDLPNVNKKLKIIIISDSEDQFVNNVDGSNVATENNTKALNNKNNFLSSALRWSLDIKKKHHIDLDLGVKFRFPLSPFARAYYAKKIKLNSDWQMTFSQTLFAVLNDESGETTRLDFDRRIAEKLALRFSNWATWSDESEGVDLNQTLTINQHICLKSAVSYGVGWKSITDPQVRSDQYNMFMNYRQNVFRPWMFFIVKPYAEFTRKNDWNSDFKIEFLLQAYFGKSNQKK
jgi:hypothetical protein